MASSSHGLAAEALSEGMQLRRQFNDNNGIVQVARLIGGAMVTLLLVAVVLNEVFNAVNVGSGPFSSIGTDLQTTGVAAISLLIVGLIVVAANRIMGIFNSGGGM